MVDLPGHIKESIDHCVAGRYGLADALDEEVRSHRAIALMGTIGAIWGLRSDGTFWQFDTEFDGSIAPLPEEREILAIAYGAERHPWLKELLPVRPEESGPCPICHGERKFQVSVGLVMCPACRGLGWVA